MLRSVLLKLGSDRGTDVRAGPDRPREEDGHVRLSGGCPVPPDSLEYVVLHCELL